jgi:hypothetical protein
VISTLRPRYKSHNGNAEMRSCKLVKAATGCRITKNPFGSKHAYGEVAEWLMAPVLKTHVPEVWPDVSD